MTYLILNLLLGIFAIWCSTHVVTKDAENESAVINLLMISGAIAFIMAGANALIIYNGPVRFTEIVEHVLLLLDVVFFSLVAQYFLSFQKSKVSFFVKLLTFIFIAAGAYVSIAKISIENLREFTITSLPVFTGNLAILIPITWEQVFIGFYKFALPGFSMIIMLLKSENSNSRLSLQKASINVLGMVFYWLGYLFLMYCIKRLPMLKVMYPFFYAALALIFVRSLSHNKIYDFTALTTLVLKAIVRFVIPAFSCALIYVVLRPMYNKSHGLYVVLVFCFTLLAVYIFAFLSRMLSKFSNLRSAQYDTAFEEALSQINYDAESKEVCDNLLAIFKNYVSTQNMTVLTDNGNNELSVAYTSNENNFTVNINSRFIDVLLNTNTFILFKEDVAVNHELQEVRAELDELFIKSKSEAIIVMNEGRHVLGIIFLGEKRTGGSYDDYDKVVFTKLYSYFFVFGYYMKNIANASVVGTVNREIRMSAQIITSIQENMDYLNNPKMDAGYLMVPAHNIGGEFVDMIHLTATRHIFVIGSVSGKGISASMSMVIMKSIIRTYLATTHDFKKLVQKVNEFIRFNLPKGTFFAGLFCLMDFKTDTLYYINCGIPTMLLYTQAYSNVIEIQGKGYVLGFVKNIMPIAKVKQMHLNPGDIVGVSTNGLIDSHSLRGEQFGKDRLKQAITDNFMYPASRMVSFAMDSLKHFMSKELESDITMLFLKYMGKDAVVAEDEESVAEDGNDEFNAESEDEAVEPSVEENVSEQDETSSESLEQPSVENNELDSNMEIPNMDSVVDSNVDDTIDESIDFPIEESVDTMSDNLNEMEDFFDESLKNL